MNNNHITEYLDYYVNSENINFAVLVKGRWGSGKTFFVKKLIEKWSTPDIANDEFIALNPIYISLNGLSSKRDIIDKLKEKINPFLYSKGVKMASSVVKGFLKSTLRIDFDYDADEKNDGALTLNLDPISIFKADNENIKGNRILIFDDIERCKIPIDEVYGFINDFVEHSKCKVILISDEDKIIEKDDKQDHLYSYRSFKEKIIGQVFEIKPNSEEAIDYFISLLQSDTQKLLVGNRQLIINIFNSSVHKNLRVLQRSFFNFERLLGLLDPELKKDDENYKVLIKSLLAYYIIFHIEYNTGNEGIKHFQQLFLSEDKKYDFQNYEEAIKSSNLIHSTKIFTAEKLLEYISNGSYERIVEEINRCSIFHPTEEKNWEKLWYWKFMDDESFKKVLAEVDREFFDTDALHFTEVLHIAGILLNLADQDLYDTRSKADIVNRAKALFVCSEDLSKVQDISSILRTSWRKAYASEHTVEFQEILSTFKQNTKECQRKAKIEYVEKVIYNLNDENVDELFESFKDYDWSSKNILENTPIFENISGKKLSDIVFELDSKTVYELNGYFNYRYQEPSYSHHQIEEYKKLEANFINELRADLIEKCSNLHDKPLKLKTIKNLIEDLGKISLRLT